MMIIIRIGMIIIRTIMIIIKILQRDASITESAFYEGPLIIYLKYTS